MEPLIYYPSFEPPDQNWLKFALLYFENFKPIVPYNRRELLSDDFRRIQENTDLISLYAPGYEEGERAALSAIEEVEKFLSNTYERSPLFRQINVLRKWHDQNTWTYQIYREKFSDNWARFCIDNNIGRRNDEGLLLSEELAFLFMTYLAKEIAFSENAAIITDNNRFDNFTNQARTHTPSFERGTKFAKGIISLLVPRNLSQIPYDTLIQFRHRNRELIRSFNAELGNIQERISEGYSEQDFLDSYNNVYSEFSREVFLQGIGVASIPFAMYLLIKSPQATSPEYTKEILGSLGIVLGGGYTLNKALKDNRSRRYCKKYLTNLQRLK